jgi:hypothetical protein
MMTAEERYQRDPAFHTMVDLLEQLVHKGEYTPTELREAVVLAATHYEMRRPPFGFSDLDGVAELVEE